MAIALVYLWPNASPSATPPTQATKAPVLPTNQVGFNKVTATLAGDGVSTSVVVTHNFNLTTAELAADWPEVRVEPIVSGGPSFFVSARAQNSVTLNFSATFVGTFGICRLDKPLTQAR